MPIKQERFDLEPKKAGPVQCLGMTFENDEARRGYFLERLEEKLQDPEFRKIAGFPKGTDEDILLMSDPPYYTACPNPFLEQFVRVYGRPYDPNEEYHREPFAVDVSVGKTDPLYKAHSYHTKIPHLAIVPSILHYTDAGDVILDGFAGSGMTGVAAQWCGTASLEYRRQLERQWQEEGRGIPSWGTRRVILGDLAPAASFIAAGYNLSFEPEEYVEKFNGILDRAMEKLGWMYETNHTDGASKGQINYTVWSEVFTCPDCSAEVVFLEEALDPETKRVKDSFPCRSCRAELTKDKLERSYEVRMDPVTGQPWTRVRLKPILINYSFNGKEYEKRPDADDMDRLARIEQLPIPGNVPAVAFPFDDMWEAPRLKVRGITHTHHLFLARPLHSLAIIWSLASAERDADLRRGLLFTAEQGIRNMSLLNAYEPLAYSQNARGQKGAYYVPSQHAEVSPMFFFSGKVKRLARAFGRRTVPTGALMTFTGDCASISLPGDSVDYIFTDPPFGDNIPYAELNFLVEAWHRVFTDPAPEAVVDRTKVNRSSQKGLLDYQLLMQRCFAEYFRVLKPGRWITVVFSNSKNSVWRAIQEALGRSGFVVADVRTLDKQQLSSRQVVSSAVKQDLVISAYKPTTTLSKRFSLGASSPESAWAFVTEHLSNAPVFLSVNAAAATIIERTPQMLHDRMVAFHVQRQLSVPLSTSEFLLALNSRYSERDGMYFLPDQAEKYDRQRAKASGVTQLSFLITDEPSLIHWVRMELDRRPQSFQDLNPVIMKEIQAWARHEKTVELKDVLEENFLLYDGTGPVPVQIHTYLSSNFRDMRGLSKEDPVLKAKAAGRWYVPDPNKQADLDQLRTKRLLKEFQEYKEAKQRKLKQFRTESIRAGFKAAYDQKDYRTIVEVANKLPEQVIQEDEKLLMYRDVASMRLGED